MYSSKKKPSPGPGDAASSEIREPAEEYAPVIFAQDTYKHVVSLDMLSGKVSTHTHTLTFPTAQARAVKRKLQSLVFAMCSSLKRFHHRYLFVSAPSHRITNGKIALQEDRDNILRARASGKGVLTAPFKLLNNRLGVISTYTVYKHELPPTARQQERIQAAIG